ncbi:hypothetical protein [Caudovirales GX15bay]|nr:hypothetical protein [Caudovirales GX15bay]
MILLWHQNLPESDLPPRWMWHLDEELERHFDRVKARRANGDSFDDGGDGFVVRNEYAKGRGA